MFEVELENVICGICGEKIEKPFKKVEIIINLEEGDAQQMFTHIHCLKNVVHESVPIALWEDE